MSDAAAIIVGGGPAGLAAAIELRRHGVGPVVVLEREREAGGIPRHTDHTGFGLRDLHRMLSGPRYAARYRRLAARAGVDVRTETSVTGWGAPASVAIARSTPAPGESNARADGLRDRAESGAPFSRTQAAGPPFVLDVTSPRGRSRISADAVVLATGCRERPRAARLVPGSRPLGVLTTGTLQQLVAFEHAPIGRRAVVVGAEHVSFSAVLTLAHGGADTAAMVTDLPRHQSHAALAWLAAGRRRVPILTSSAVTGILGRRRVEAVEVTALATGRTRRIDCDTVVFTGDWIPDHELARLGGLAIDAATRAPRVDGALRTSARGVFATGNLVHAAESADVAALSGRHVATAVRSYLASGAWPARAPVPIVCVSPVRWVSPSAIDAASAEVPHGRFLLRVDAFRTRAVLEARQDARVLWRRRYRELVPARSIHADAAWVRQVDADGGAVSFTVAR